MDRIFLALETEKPRQLRLNRGRVENRGIFSDSPTQPERRATTCAAHRRDDSNLHSLNISKSGISVNPRQESRPGMAHFAPPSRLIEKPRKPKKGARKTAPITGEGRYFSRTY
jgi:hypothetical protein